MEKYNKTDNNTAKNINSVTLCNLIRDNPDLPVVPMVDSDVFVEEGYGYYMGELGTSYIGEYAVYDDRVFDDREEFEEHYYDVNYKELDAMFKDDKSLKKFLHQKAEQLFTKAILLKIN